MLYFSISIQCISATLFLDERAPALSIISISFIMHFTSSVHNVETRPVLYIFFNERKVIILFFWSCKQGFFLTRQVRPWSPIQQWIVPHCCIRLPLFVIIWSCKVPDVDVTRIGDVMGCWNPIALQSFRIFSFISPNMWISLGSPWTKIYKCLIGSYLLTHVQTLQLDRKG